MRERRRMWWRARRGLEGRSPAAARDLARGFTLVELLVALVILVLAWAVAVPALRGTSSAELDAAARQFAAGLRQARSEAITRNRSYGLEIDVEARRFRLEGGGGSRSVASGIDLDLYTARSERIDDDRATIRFFPDGSSTGGRVGLRAGQRTLAVDVDWLTGRIRILEGDEDPGARAGG